MATTHGNYVLHHLAAGAVLQLDSLLVWLDPRLLHQTTSSHFICGHRHCWQPGKTSSKPVAALSFHRQWTKGEATMRFSRQEGDLPPPSFFTSGLRPIISNFPSHLGDTLILKIAIASGSPLPISSPSHPTSLEPPPSWLLFAVKRGSGVAVSCRHAFFLIGGHHC